MSVKEQYDAWDRTEKGCGPLIIFILALLCGCLYLFGCNDSTPSHTIIDSTKIEKPQPAPVDTSRLGLFTAISEVVSKMTYVLGNATPIEMKGGDNYEVLQEIVNRKVGTYQIPNGGFYISKSLKFENSNVVLIGSGNTIINVEPGQDAVEITGGGPTIARIKFSSNPNIGTGTGVKLHAVAKLIEVWVHGFGGGGISVTADIEANGTNASHSQILFCTISECGGDAIYFKGGDANACDVIAPDVRDNKGWGINDESFLGNTFINPMAHSNKKGHYRVAGANARSVFIIGEYGEEDSPPSEFGGVTRVYVKGGLLGYEVTPDKQFYKGTNTPYRGSGGYIITSPYAKVDTQ